MQDKDYKSDSENGVIIQTSRLEEESVQVGEQEPQVLADEQDGGYGWVCVACQFMITANTWGVSGAFGVYLTQYLSDNAFPELSEVSYSFIGGLQIAQITFIAPVVTLAVEKFGTRPTIFIGIVLETAGLIGASFGSKAWHLFLTQGLLFAWGCAFSYIATVAIIPQWFTKRRGIANGIAAAGGGLGGLVYSLITEAMIEHLGDGWSFRITAICTAVLNIICAILIRDRNHHIEPTHNAFDFRLFKRPELLLIILWTVFATLGYTIVLFTLPDNAARVGLTATQGSIIGALANLGTGIGGPLIGYLSDRYGRVNTIISTTLAAGLLCLGLWTSGTTYPTLLAFSILGGIAIMIHWATIPALIADIFGMKELPSALSIVWTLLVFPSTFAEAIALALRRSSAPIYLNVQIFTGCIYVAGALCIVALRFMARNKLAKLADKQ